MVLSGKRAVINNSTVNMLPEFFICSLFFLSTPSHCSSCAFLVNKRERLQKGSGQKRKLY